MRAFLGMGSNMGDRLGYLRDAVDALDEVVAVSPIYETEPVGGPDQGAFLNIVVQLETQRSPRELLEECWRLETAAARVREERWGPRTLDVDVLWVDGYEMNDSDLTIPHVRMRERAFVMIPLGHLAPDLVVGWVDPNVGQVRQVAEWDEVT